VGSFVSIGVLAVLFLVVRGGDGSLPEPESPTEPEWRWPNQLTPEQVRVLTVVRDRCLEELAALGAGPDERLAEVRVDADDAAAIRKAVHDLSYVQRQGSAHLIRKNRRDRLVAAYGVKGVPFLSEALAGDRYWSARGAAQALRQLLEGPNGAAARWLMFHFQTPAALIAMFSTGPDNEVLGLNIELNATLGALLDPKLAKRLDAELELSQPTSVEASLRQGKEAQAAWSKAWSGQYQDWQAAERDRENDRRELERKLTLLRQGVNPEMTRPSE
jgi:hypothetical protein